MKTPRKTCAFHWAVSAVLLILCLPLIALAEPFETIVDNGNAMNRVDITILGDGYTAAEMQKYRNDVQALMTQFFNHEPFREYRNFFNVHRIDVVSSQSGADHPERSWFVNTALDATYNCNQTQRLICINFTKANTIVGNSVAPAQRDIVFVIVNDAEYDGVFQSTGAEFTVTNLAAGSHVVDAVVKDNTPMVRKDIENLLLDNRTWNLTVNSAPAPTPTPTPSPTPKPSPAPLLLLEQNSNSAIAVDSVSLLRYPFPVSTVPNYSSDGHTRLLLFALNVELQAGENLSFITAEAEDSQQTVYPLIVEYVGRVPNFDSLTQINLRLPDNLASAGNVLLSIKVRGVQSNKVLVNIRPPL
jgi:hypothetical protein